MLLHPERIEGVSATSTIGEGEMVIMDLRPLADLDRLVITLDRDCGGRIHLLMQTKGRGRLAREDTTFASSAVVA
mgnify:CR=1 FL=1